MDELIGLSQEDPEAMMQALRRQYIRGACVKFEVGAPYFLQDSNFTGSKLKIRIASSNQSLWTLNNFVAAGACPAAVAATTESPALVRPSYRPAPRLVSGERKPAEPRMAAPEPRACEWKAVMSDEDIAACRTD